MKILILFGLIGAHAFLTTEPEFYSTAADVEPTDETVTTGAKIVTTPEPETSESVNTEETEIGTEAVTDPEFSTGATATKEPSNPGTEAPQETNAPGTEDPNTETTTSESPEQPSTKPTTTQEPEGSGESSGDGGQNTTTEEPVTGTTGEPLKTETTEEEDEGPNLALILGLTFGCTAAVALGGAGVWYFFFRKNTVEIADVETVEKDEASDEE
ncbi:Oidioi.mRNA.OKI2018_I69.chr2.g6455.t1.cds [Oikopleura dioica]|uniref:Oidioi.mRNA.OKI2018_I69.chr2.g6455.t1.cds n=1 Tax=Oikopleura dioica TaxID=34765 RepID=A0ABN7T6Y1_OIKDI|nr:Oidioi.mRNA.OKI2018_I69.chr2.g6455.t1.cds [Oikopleura dioica]